MKLKNKKSEVKVSAPVEVKERAPRSTLYPADVASFQKDIGDGVFCNRHGVWLLQPKDSALGAIPFTETHKLRDFDTGKLVPAMLTRDEKETYDTACVVRIRNKLEQGYVAKGSDKQPRKFADKAGKSGMKVDCARWESASSGFVAIGKAAKVPLYFVA